MKQRSSHVGLQECDMNINEAFNDLIHFSGTLMNSERNIGTFCGPKVLELCLSWVCGQLVNLRSRQERNEDITCRPEAEQKFRVTRLMDTLQGTNISPKKMAF